jgi:F0F1-type ATP synthase epsilon subunit
MGTIVFHIFTPEGSLPEKKIERIVTRSPQGELAVLPGHSPFLCSLRETTLQYESAGITEKIYVQYGLLHVTKKEIGLFLQSKPEMNEQ